jgi:hypothetical protein
MEYLNIPGIGDVELSQAIEDARELRKRDWEFEKWVSQPALIDRNGGTSRSYVGQSFDSSKIELVEDGWTHDHCEMCYCRISEGDDNSEFEIEGYKSGSSWICIKCYVLFVEPKTENQMLTNFVKVIK